MASAATAACPWAHLTTSTPAIKSPKLQEILDEELATQLCEAELLALEQASPCGLDDVYGHLQEKARAFSSEDDDLDPDDELNDNDDDADEYPDDFSPTSCPRGRHARRRHVAPSKINLDGQFDKRTRFMLNRLAGRGKLSAVKRRLHAGARSLLHHAMSVPQERSDAIDEPAEPHHLVVKILKAPSGDFNRVTSEALELSGRPMNAEMVETSVRRQLKIQVTHEYTSLSRAVAHGVRAPAPHCFMEHVLAMQFHRRRWLHGALASRLPAHVGAADASVHRRSRCHAQAVPGRPLGTWRAERVQRAVP
ncbi:hypothetical protein PINS_up015142 [Pythium insidiosum]|nr:hypothetical protein PINS_up015142 [Pythium insidiosum]